MSKSWPFALPTTQRTTTIESNRPLPTANAKAQSTSLTFWVGVILFLGLLVLILAVVLIVFLFQKPAEPPEQIQVDWQRRPFVLS